LPDAPDRSRAQHRGDAGHYILDGHTRSIRNLLERLANKSFDLVLRNARIFALIGSLCSTGSIPINPPARASLSNWIRRCSDCANKHRHKMTATAGKHEQMPDEMAITHRSFAKNKVPAV
jgi:hypothetical protein